VEEIIEEEVSPLPKEAPKVELKPLPSNLRYEFLGPNATYPVIVNASLYEVETNKLMYVLKKYPKAIGYTIDDIKGINPSLCMHTEGEKNHKKGEALNCVFENFFFYVLKNCSQVQSLK